jgi:hypothetical protein
MGFTPCHQGVTGIPTMRRPRMRSCR